MSVWKRVRNYAKTGFTSIIHGKASHEETRATSSRALGDSGNGQYLVILTLADVDYVCDYIRQGGDKEAFYERFKGADAYSPGFDPDIHLKQIGVANQTTKELLPDWVNESKRISDVAESLGLIVRPIGHLNVMSPPLTITEADVDFIADTLETAIVRVSDDLTREGIALG